jgi:NAD(P)-dependent dehydrogenase (short-subunit alcohol dehydrogenase family)
MIERIRLNGRVVAVTGAAGVIGSATIQPLAERRARIVERRNPGSTPVPPDKVGQRIPANGLGQTAEVPSVEAFLTADGASDVSGSAFTVDGGRTAS